MRKSIVDYSGKVFTGISKTDSAYTHAILMLVNPNIDRWCVKDWAYSEVEALSICEALEASYRKIFKVVKVTQVIECWETYKTKESDILKYL